MTPKDKAVELVNLYCQLLAIRDYENKDKAKQYALITVEQIINANPSYDDYGGDGWKIIDNSDYWREVKQEIENL